MSLFEGKDDFLKASDAGFEHSLQPKPEPEKADLQKMKELLAVAMVATLDFTKPDTEKQITALRAVLLSAYELGRQRGNHPVADNLPLS